MASTWITVISFLSEASRQNKCISYSQETVRVREASPNIKPCLFGHCPNGGVETLAQMVCGSSSENKMHQKCCQHHGYQNALVCHGLLLSAIVRLGCCWLGPLAPPCNPCNPCTPCTLAPLHPLAPLAGLATIALPKLKQFYTVRFHDFPLSKRRGKRYANISSEYFFSSKNVYGQIHFV